MYLSLLFITFILVAPSHTFPVDIQARGRNAKKCANAGEVPCVCGEDGNLVSIREKKLFNCGTSSFKYTNPNDEKDGSVEYVRGLALNEFRRSQPL